MLQAGIIMYTNFFHHSHLFLLTLGARAFPLNGEWDGIEHQILIDGAVSDKKSIPYEECYPSIDPETQEPIENTSTCIERGFTMQIDGVEEILFEATNNLNEGQQVSLQVVSQTVDAHLLSDGDRFDISCALDTTTKEKLLYCDFSNTIGYLKDTRIVFSEAKD